MFKEDKLEDRVFKGLVEIDSVTFHDIKFSGNIHKMDKEWNDKKKYSANETITLNESWLKLYDEYFEKTDDVRYRKQLKNKKQNLALLLEIKTIEEIIEVLKYIDSQKDFMPSDVYLETVSKIVNSLKELNRNIKFEVLKPIQEQINGFDSVLGGLQSRYEILFKEDLSVEEFDLQLYYDIKTEIELTLDARMPEYMNMLNWISYEKQYIKKINSIKRQNDSKK